VEHGLPRRSRWSVIVTDCRTSDRSTAIDKRRFNLLIATRVSASLSYIQSLFRSQLGFRQTLDSASLYGAFWRFRLPDAITLQWLQISGNSLQSDLSTGCLLSIFRSTPPSRPNKVGLKCPSARPYVRTHVRPSTKCFFDFNETSYIGIGRRVMHDSMQYDPIHNQGQGHEPSKVGNSAIFKGYLFPRL